MLDPELKVKWIEALRSGKYKQGRVKLKKQSEIGQGYEFCCLGVLKEIEPSVQEMSSGMFLKDACGVNRDTQVILANMNDGITDVTGIRKKAASFTEIADYIEKSETL